MTDKKCKDIVEGKLKSRIEDLRLVWAGYKAGYEYGDFDPLHTMGDMCPICEACATTVDNNTTICKPCFNQLKYLGEFQEYGLCFDYVAPETFDDQKEGYFRYQISCGGPSDEFRFFVNPGPIFSVHRIEYWYLDWFDGAPVTLSGDDLELMTEIYGHFDECETTKHEFNKATEGV